MTGATGETGPSCFGATCSGTTTFATGPFTFDSTAPVTFAGTGVTFTSNVALSVAGPATIAGTGVTVSPASNGNVVINTTGSGVVKIDAPQVASGAGVQIGTTAPASTAYVQVGTRAGSGVLVRANLHTEVFSSGTGAYTCNTTTQILISGGCDCGANQVRSSVISGTPPSTITCTCSSGTATAYGVCLNVPN